MTGTVKSGKGKGKGKGKGGGKFVHITESIDVGVPLDVAYNHWTRFEDFSTWAKGVRSVDRSDDISSEWKVKVGPSSRSWKANVRTQVPDERIAWTSEGAKGTTRGVVTFHELGERLTRVVVVLEYHPSGPVEKIGNLWRAQGRRVRLDLKHFRHFVAFAEDEDTEGWRGEIRDGEVVGEPEDDGEPHEDEDTEEGDEPADEDEAEDYDDEYEDEPDDESEDEEGEEDEEDEEDEYVDEADDESEEADDEDEDEDEEDEEDEDEEDEDEEDAEDEYEGDNDQYEDEDDEYEDDEDDYEEEDDEDSRVRASR
ncbi:SRPBCC family protein [Streptodolium elevatio]|uniref:SRPBCC family protein n=1 Tax=Streptodolium elevatio TaxID=3157996 RepID=A0ABV3DU14_9ACTN